LQEVVLKFELQRTVSTSPQGQPTPAHRDSLRQKVTDLVDTKTSALWEELHGCHSIIKPHLNMSPEKPS